MEVVDCHIEGQSPRERARSLILDTLGVRRIAQWCSVEESTVYQWLVRGTDDMPIPPPRLPLILAGARAEGLAAPLDVLWPALAHVLESSP